MSEIKLLLVGIGGYAGTYVNPLLDGAFPGAEIAACADPFPASCPRIDEIRARNIPVYADMADFFAAGGSADLAVITTPIHLHARQMIFAMEHGCHVLCEKPLCGDADDIPALLDAEQRTGKYAAIGYQWSHSEAIQALKADILAGFYGDPVLLKTMVLWPRDRAYYGRGSGWAGKLRARDGSLILDSVASNATAHYLHNMLYVLGDRVDTSAMPVDVKAELSRANAIENYDTCRMELTFAGGARALFLASHATLQKRDPIFEYRFTKGCITYAQSPETKDIIGTLADGTVKNYGDPFLNQTAKLARALAAVKDSTVKSVCGITAAAPHLRVITAAQSTGVKDFAPSRIRENPRGTGVYVDGLYEEMMEAYGKEGLR